MGICQSVLAGHANWLVREYRLAQMSLAGESGFRLNVEHQATVEPSVSLDEGGGVSRIFHKKTVETKIVNILKLWCELLVE